MKLPGPTELLALFRSKPTPQPLRDLGAEAAAEVAEAERKWEADPTDERWQLVRAARDKRDQIGVQLHAAEERDRAAAEAEAARVRADKLAELAALRSTVDTFVERELAPLVTQIADAHDVIASAVHASKGRIQEHRLTVERAIELARALGVDAPERPDTMRLGARFLGDSQRENAVRDEASGHHEDVERYCGSAHVELKRELQLRAEAAKG